MGQKSNENPQKFIDEVYNIEGIMGLFMIERAKLAAYQLKGVAQVWFEQWRGERVVDAGVLDWRNSKEYFLIISFSLK